MLRVSSEFAEQAVNLQSLNAGHGAEGVAYGDLLLGCADAVYTEDEDEIAASRDRLLEAMGSAAVVDAAAVASNFQRMVRIADGAGITLGNLEDFSAVAREELDLSLLWETAREDLEEGGQLGALADLYFGDASAVQRLALLQALEEDRAYFKRGKAWIDGAMVAGENAPKTLEPDVVIEFGTPAFEKLLDALVKANRQGVLARRGDLYLRFENKTILVRNDWTEEEKDK